MIKPSSSRLFLPVFLFGALILLGLPSPLAAFFFGGDDWPVEVEGMGWRGNREIRNILRILVDREEGRPFVLTRDWMEDAAFLLEGEVKKRGFLEPRVFLVMTTTGEDQSTVVHREEWTGLLPDNFGRDFVADSVVYDVERGVLSFYESVELEGLPDLAGFDGAGFFFQENTLFQGKRSRFFTPSRLETSENNLLTALRQAGYRNARIVERRIGEGSEPGAKAVSLTIDPGPRSQVRQVVLKLEPPTGAEDVWEARLPRLPDEPFTFSDQPFTILWQQDFLNKLRVLFFEKGFPDTRFLVETVGERFSGEGLREVDLMVTVRSGLPINVGQIRFEGMDAVREATLRRALRLREGDPLNIFRAQDGRDGLGRLNVFRLVRLNYESTGDPLLRDIVYEGIPLPHTEVSLIFGLGTYEILRGGFEVHQNNLWSRAHQGRLRAIQSFKSTLLDYTYSVPDLFGENIRGFVNPNYLRRDEVAFTRETLGLNTGLEYFFRTARTAVRLQYTIEEQRASGFQNTLRDFQRDPVRVAGLELAVDRNTIRNPLQPEGGNKLFLRYRLAADWLGSTVSYHRVTVGATRHLSLGGGRFLHLRLQHGVIGSFEGRDDNIPLTERFFLGGEGTIRGFRQNLASPRLEDGTLFGSETYLLGNVQVEQRLIDNFSLNLFLDAAGFSDSITRYPADEGVLSVGLGLSYATVVGPLRLEYAYNPVRRERDATGALLIALGFPF